MLMREWRRLLLNDGVKVWAISPGFLATGLAGAGAEKLKQVRSHANDTDSVGLKHQPRVAQLKN